MKQSTHKLVSRIAVEWLDEIAATSLVPSRDEIGQAAYDTDDLKDVEFVDVKWNVTDGSGRDDPHKKDKHCKTIPNPFGCDFQICMDFLGVEEDKPHHKVFGLENSFTSMNHFIDIRNGLNNKKDYDGYSYEKGSAKKGQYQDAINGAACYFFDASMLPSDAPLKVDDVFNWFYDDEYVHVPGHTPNWYKDTCSPAMIHYCYPTSKSVNKELKERFPRAQYKGKKDKGIPYSRFMPVDNLVKWQYSFYLSTGDAEHLGHALHGVQDCTVPHHAAGCLGNWHMTYENDLEGFMRRWVNKDKDKFKKDVIALFNKWNNHRSTPSYLSPRDVVKVPGRNWPVDMLATWLALHAYKAYETDYNGFQNYTCKPLVMRCLAVKSVAMSMLLLWKTEARFYANLRAVSGLSIRDAVVDSSRLRTRFSVDDILARLSADDTDDSPVVSPRAADDIRPSGADGRAISATVDERTPPKLKEHVIADKKRKLFRTMNETHATNALSMLKKCKPKQIIPLGSKKHQICYVLLGGRSLATGHGQEKNKAVDTEKIRLVHGKHKFNDGDYPQTVSNWYLAVGNSRICSFGRDGVSAARAYYLIKTHKLKRFCTLGHFKYFRK